MSNEVMIEEPTIQSLDKPPLTWRDRYISLWHFYPKQMKMAVISTAQYPFAAFLWLFSLVVEPVIYLVVWTTVANEQGGEIGGYTAGGFAAYYIAWTIVRVMNISLTPVAFEWRVRQGQWSPMLLRPFHPIHQDIAFFLGMKVLDFLRLLPITILLYFVFKPDLSPTWWQAAAFMVAIVTGFLMRSIWLWALGLITFWVTRVRAIFELYFAVELILSGRVVPIDLLPAWAQNISQWLPYQWSFGFPIELVLGRLTPQETLYGFGMQLLWSLIGLGLVNLLWRYGVKQYSAVGA
jgi:ABC-2 type transport system permease protein